MPMTEEERQEKEALYGRILDAVTAAADSCPEVRIVPPEGFQSLVNGISQSWGRKGVPGVMIRSGKDGLVVEVSVSAAESGHLAEAGKKLQSVLWEALRPFGEAVSAVNIDILKIEK